MGELSEEVEKEEFPIRLSVGFSLCGPIQAGD